MIYCARNNGQKRGHNYGKTRRKHPKTQRWSLGRTLHQGSQAGSHRHLGVCVRANLHGGEKGTDSTQKRYANLRTVKEQCDILGAFSKLGKLHFLGVKISTAAHYHYTLAHYILPVLGDCRVQDLTASFLEQGLLQIIAPKNACHKPLAHSMARECLALVRRICRYAAHIRLMHPIEIEIKLPHTAPKPARVLNQHEQKRIAFFAEKSPTARKVGLLLMMQMGLRIGEVCGLQWSDFDLTAGVLSVRRTVKRIYVANGQTKVVVQTPKTRSSVRQIPIPQGILQILNQLYSSHAPQEWFLSGNAEKPVEPRCYRKSLHSYLRRAGVPAVNPHALRHTFATTCLQAGCNVKTLSELLGHAGPDITMKRYVHTCWDWKRAEMDRIFAQ